MKNVYLCDIVGLEYENHIVQIKFKSHKSSKGGFYPANSVYYEKKDDGDIFLPFLLIVLT